MATTRVINSVTSHDQDLATWLRRWRRLILISCAIGLLGSGVYAVFVPERYRAEVVCAVADTEARAGASGLGAIASKLGPIGGLAGLGAGGSQEREEIIAQLRSRPFLAEFTRDNNVGPQLFEFDWDSSRLDWHDDFFRRPRSDIEVARDFDERVLRIVTGDKSSLVRLQVEWRDPKVAMLWANDLVARVNRELALKASAESQRRIKFLQGYLARTSELEIRSALYDQLADELKRLASATVRPEFALRVIQPAYVPDRYDYVWPKRFLVLALGAIGGLALGLALATAASVWPGRNSPDRAD